MEAAEWASEQRSTDTQLLSFGRHSLSSLSSALRSAEPPSIHTAQGRVCASSTTDHDLFVRGTVDKDAAANTHVQ